MTITSYILAQGGQDDGNWMRILFGLIVVAFWLISAFATWLNKKQEEERRRRLREQIGQESRGVRRTPAPASPPAPARRPAPPPMRQPPRPQQRPMQQRPVQQRPAPQRAPQRAPQTARRPERRTTIPVAPPMPQGPPIATDAATDSTTLPVAATEISAAHPTGAASAARPAVPSASALNRWLRPETLRHQFILTEILQPPLAMRERSDLP